MTHAELKRHIQLLLDQEISTEEFGLLESELMDNPKALEIYHSYANLHCSLEKYCDVQNLVNNQSVVPIDRVLSLQRKSILKASLLGAAAIILLSVVTMWNLQGPKLNPVQAKFKIVSGSDFTLTHEGEGETPAGNTMARGSRIVLRHGVAELTLPYDVSALIEAPAEMVLRDDRTLEVHYGRGLFQVNSIDGRGFTVVTPHQHIVDLGTAFGIDFVKGSSEVQLHVLEGEVRVDSKDGMNGDIIHANRSVVLSGTKILQEIDSPPIAFLHQLPSEIKIITNENFAHGLLNGRNYKVRMESNVVTDLRGNKINGIDAAMFWDFKSVIAYSNHAATILADDFSDVIKLGNTATLEHWDTVNGIIPPSKSLPFFKGGTTAAVGIHNLVAGEIDVKNNMNTGGWDTSMNLNLDDKTTLIKLTSMTVDLRLISDSGTPNKGRNSKISIDLVGSISGLLGTVDPGFSSCPSGPYTRTLDLTSLPLLDGSETYKLVLKARGTGHGHNKSLQAIELIGNMATLDLPASHSVSSGGIGTANISTQPKDVQDDLPTMDADPNTATQIRKIYSEGELKLPFTEPIKLGTGSLVVENITDANEHALYPGSQQLVVDRNVLSIQPPVNLEDGERKLGWLADWKSTAPVLFFNPDGDCIRYSHTSLNDDSGSKGLIGEMHEPSMISIRRSISREIGTITAGSRYTVSTSIGVGARNGKAKSTFLGYTIRLSSGDIELAELTSNTPPGPANSINTVGFSWDSATLPEGVQPGDPLAIEIIPNQTSTSPGYLDLNALRISVLDY